METTMSKGYSEALALIEAGKQMALGTIREKPMRSVAEKKEKPPDLMALLDQKKREYEAVKTFVEQQTKLNKQEEKKKGWSVDHIAMFLLAMMPLNWAVMYLLIR
jgi:hypothetical protein